MNQALIIPRSAAQAKNLGKTYYKSGQPCRVHGTSFRWAENGECMSCKNAITIMQPVRKPEEMERA